MARFSPRIGTTRSQRGPITRLSLERLEDRTVPTTTAVLSNGVLTITGDGNANTITIAEQASPGSYLVAAPDLTSSPLTFPGVTSINVNTGAGTDSVTFNGNAAAGTRLSGALNISGTGSLTINLTANVNVGGHLTVNHTGTAALYLGIAGTNTTVGSLLVFDGDGNSRVDLSGGARVLGFVSLNLSAGSNTATVNDTRIDSFLSFVGTTGNDSIDIQGGARLGQNIFLDAGAGTNTFVVSGAIVAGTLNFSASGTSDTFVVQGSATVQGTAAITKTAGTGLLLVYVNGPSRIGGDLRVRGGSGNELIQVTGIIAGTLDANLQGGLNTITVSGGTIDNLLHFGTGTEVINLTANTRVRGFVSINAGTAVDVDVNVTDTAMQTFFSVVSGSGADTVDITFATINANLAFVLGGGADIVTFNNTSVFGTALFDGEAGDDLFNIERGTASTGIGTTFFGPFTFRGGSQADRINLGLNATDDAVFLADATFDGISGIDIVDRAFAEFVGPRPSFNNVVLTPMTVFAVTSTNVLVTFEPTNSTVLTGTLPITGLQAGENVIAIDFRPATGQLFGITSNDRIVTISPTTGAATVGITTTLAGTDVGFDFNPVPDALRIVSDAGENLRITGGGSGSVNTDGNLNYAAGDVNAGATANVVAAAYANNFAGATSTTLYGIDSILDVLVRQSPPNDGNLNTIGTLGVNASDLAGFDITDGNAAYAVLNVGGVSKFYIINLTTGSTTLVGNVGPVGAGSVTIVGIAIPAPSGF